MEPDALSRDPQYGTTKNTAINMHQFIKATPRSNILKAARLIQNRQNETLNKGEVEKQS
jgi:hypothetical protein